MGIRDSCRSDVRALFSRGHRRGHKERYHSDLDSQATRKLQGTAATNGERYVSIMCAKDHVPLRHLYV